MHCARPADDLSTFIQYKGPPLEKLPTHGRIDCTRCFDSCGQVEFDETKRTEGDWRITANPLAWGNDTPDVIVLGFSKGPTQAGATGTNFHDDIAFKNGRAIVGKILNHIGLLPLSAGEDMKQAVSRLIADQHGRFHFGSMVRCTVEQFKKGIWIGSGCGMLDKFVAAPFGKEISTNCTERFLKYLPARTKLIVMFGTGSKLSYVRESFSLYKKARGGEWQWINDVAYTDGKVTVVHVEHFKSLGAYVPQWLGEGKHKNHKRAAYGVMAAIAVAEAVARCHSEYSN